MRVQLLLLATKDLRPTLCRLRRGEHAAAHEKLLFLVGVWSTQNLVSSGEAAKRFDDLEVAVCMVLIKLIF